ncbi:MAG: type II and III secretion system protein [Elusimicrobiota bacterium]
MINAEQTRNKTRNRHGTRIWFLFLLFTIFYSLFSILCLHAEQEMVEVSVEVTEINNDKASELGIKWFDTINTSEVSWKDPSGLRVIPDETGNVRSPVNAIPEVPSIIKVGDWVRYSALTADLKFLIKKGAAQILSKPKIVTKSGTTAKFLIGGSFPVVAAGVSGGSVEWKEYGIKTEVLPKILPDRSIDLVLTTEVSRLDWANKVQGYPAILTRTATSNVKIKSEQTIALAGMIETKKEDTIVGVPILMDIPVLGYLFSKKDKTETKTTVLIFVTPKILE